MKNYLFLFAFLFLLAACQSGEQEGNDQVAAMTESVMAVHDEVMPMMGEMNQMSQQLKAQAEAANDPEAAQAAKEAAMALDQASEGMMAWMRQYEPVAPGMEEAQAVAYLEEQQKKVDQVKTDMLSSIEQAKTILNETPEK